MEGIYTEDLLLYGADVPDLKREYSTLLVPWEGWQDTETSVACMDTEYIQTTPQDNDAEYAHTMPPSCTEEAPQELFVTDTEPKAGYVESMSLSLIDEIVDTTLQPTETHTEPRPVETATDWGYTTPTAVVDVPARLNKRGLPMRHSAMQVEERVKSIVKWENATEDSAVVREIASSIDQEITRESSRKRIRLVKTDADPIAYDSEMSDGADGESEGEQESEPDPDDPDLDFVVADEHAEDEMEEADSEIPEDAESDSADSEEESEHEETEDEESEDEESEDGESEDESDLVETEELPPVSISSI